MSNRTTSLTSSAYEVAQRSILAVRTDHHSKLQVCFGHLAGGTYTREYLAYFRLTIYFLWTARVGMGTGDCTGGDIAMSAGWGAGTLQCPV